MDGTLSDFVGAEHSSEAEPALPKKISLGGKRGKKKQRICQKPKNSIYFPTKSH